MSSLDHMNATTAHGPAVVEWLEKHERLEFVSETSRKRIQRWRRGAQASYWALDHVLIEFGRHPSELPDSVWIRYRNGRAA